MHPSVVHTLSGLKEAAGGVARSVPGLCEALAGEGCRTILVTQTQADAPQDPPMRPDAKLVETHLLRGYDWEHLRFSFTPRLGNLLESICIGAMPCVVHDHGLWLHMNHVAAVTTNRLGIKRVVSPRGMLDEWSLQYRGWKKKLAWLAYQGRDLRSASAFCATSVREAESIRALSLRQPIAVIPNGIHRPLVQDRVRHSAGLRTVVFMSRLHPKKGLLDLVAAWARVGLPGWRLVIAGPDEGGYRHQVKEAVRQTGMQAGISLVGPVEGSAKGQLLASADIFVLPTYSENFGLVVGEALSYGVPVITTNVTPWDALRSNRCGWWIDTGAAPLASALAEAMALSDDQRAEMGQRGRALIEKAYSWRSVAGKHIELYNWLLHGFQKPGWLFD